MRRSGRTGLVATFQLPPGAPPEVAEAVERFDHVAARWAERAGEAQDAEAAIEAAREQDRQAAVEAALAGKDIDGLALAELETAARARAEALRATLEPLAEAVDAAGNELAETIGPAREAWLPELRAEAEEAAARYDEAIAAAQAALDDLSRARSAADWTERYDVHEARAGRVPGWLGRGPHCRSRISAAASMASASCSPSPPG